MALFFATLSGAQEVPPRPSMATGSASLDLDPTETFLRVILRVNNINQATVAHIHLGRPGQNGPIVLFLYGPAAPMSFGPNTVLTNRTFTAANLTGPLAGRTIADLAREMRSGNAYVNVHTTMFPEGEIRGQVVPL